MLWQASDQDEKEELIGRQLWVAANLIAWEEEIAQNSGSALKTGKAKRLARQKKKGPLGHVGMLD